jgi:hypothetical protein
LLDDFSHGPAPSATLSLHMIAGRNKLARDRGGQTDRAYTGATGRERRKASFSYGSSTMCQCWPLCLCRPIRGAVLTFVYIHDQVKVSPVY